MNEVTKSGGLWDKGATSVIRRMIAQDRSMHNASQLDGGDYVEYPWKVRHGAIYCGHADGGPRFIDMMAEKRFLIPCALQRDNFFSAARGGCGNAEVKYDSEWVFEHKSVSIRFYADATLSNNFDGKNMDIDRYRSLLLQNHKMSSIGNGVGGYPSVTYPWLWVFSPHAEQDIFINHSNCYHHVIEQPSVEEEVALLSEFQKQRNDLLTN